MNKRKLAKLQRMIDRAAKFNSLAHAAEKVLIDFCIEEYGTEPGEVDADNIIDAVMGGSGACSGMDAQDFHDTMEQFRQ